MKFLTQKGMTLVELIVVTAILIVISVPISIFLFSMYNSTGRSTQYLEAENISRQIMYNIKEDLGTYEGTDTNVTVDGNLVIGPNKSGTDTYKVYYEERITNPGLYRKLIKNEGESSEVELENRKIISSDTGSLRLKSIEFSKENDVIYIKLTVIYGVGFGDLGTDFTLKSSYRKKVVPTSTP